MLVTFFPSHTPSGPGPKTTQSPAGEEAEQALSPSMKASQEKCDGMLAPSRKKGKPPRLNKTKALGLPVRPSVRPDLSMKCRRPSRPYKIFRPSVRPDLWTGIQVAFFSAMSSCSLCVGAPEAENGTVQKVLKITHCANHIFSVAGG